MSCCPIKLQSLKQIPESQALLTNRITELDRQILSIEDDIKSEQTDHPGCVTMRNMRARGIQQRMIDDILSGVQVGEFKIDDIKASRLAELTIIKNRMVAQRAEIAAFVESMVVNQIAFVAEPVIEAPEAPVEAVLTDEQIISNLKAQLAELEALKLEIK